jgi:LysM repeat protein
VSKTTTEIKVSADASDLLKPTTTSHFSSNRRELSSSESKNLNLDEKTGTLSVSAGPMRTSDEDELYIPDTETISVYSVKEGDTLPEIAETFGVSVNTILWANDLTSKKIKEGDEIVILPVSGIYYTVKKGDTLKSIAKKYKGDAADIAFFNGLALEDGLSIDDRIVIPDGEMPEAVVAKAKKTKTKTKNVVVSGAIVTNGYYIRPIVGGRRTTGIHGHNAVDLASSFGTPVMASADGRVIISKRGGWNGGYGSYVVVSHNNGTQTLYAHLQETSVSVGETVSQGQTVGLMGSTGKSTGPHVHFEIHGARNPF